MPDEAREETLDRTHCLERKMYHSMSEMVRRALYFIPQERPEVHVCQNEFNTHNLLVKARACPGEESTASALLIPGQCEKAGDEPEYNEDEDEIRHGD